MPVINPLSYKINSNDHVDRNRISFGSSDVVQVRKYGNKWYGN